MFRPNWFSHRALADPVIASRNLLFAIGARYSHLINAECSGDERDQ